MMFIWITETPKFIQSKLQEKVRFAVYANDKEYVRKKENCSQ